MPIDRRRLAVAFAGTAAFIDMYATQALLAELSRDFGASEAAVSLTITVTTLAVALVAPIAGSIADVVGRKRVIVASAFALVVPTLLIAATDTLGGLLVWRFIQGLFIPPIFAVTVAYIGEEWPPSEIGPVTALYIGGTILGGFGGRFITGLAAGQWGWNGAFVVLALANLVCAVVIAVFLPRERSFRRSGGMIRSLAKMAIHIRNPQLAATYAIGFAVLFSLAATFTYVNFYLAAPPFHLDPAALGAVFAVYLVGVVATPVSGGWIRRFGRRATVCAAVGMSVSGLLLTLVPGLAVVVVGLALCATGIFIVQAAATSYLPVAATEAKGAAAGLYITFYYLGGSAGALAPSLVWAGFGWLGCVLMVAAVEAVALALALCFWQPRLDPGARTA